MAFEKKFIKMLHRRSDNTQCISTSTNLTHVLMMIILTLCRKVTINIKLEKRLFVYFCLIVFGGLIGDFSPLLIKTFIPIQLRKNNFLNLWFVKIGWFWTVILLTPFLHLTTKILSLTRDEDEDNHFKNTKLSKSYSKVQEKFNLYQSLLQEIINYFQNENFYKVCIFTTLFFTSTSIFTWFDEKTSTCSNASIKEKVDCLKLNYRWSGFDISGHTFLLLFSNLIILKECSVMKGWEPFGEKLLVNQQLYKRSYKMDEPQYLAFNAYNKYIRALFVLLTFLSLIWDFMLVQTALFYHTMIQKFIAFIWATGLWFFLYKVLFKSQMYIYFFKQKKDNLEKNLKF